MGTIATLEICLISDSHILVVFVKNILSISTCKALGDSCGCWYVVVCMGGQWLLLHVVYFDKSARSGRRQTNV